MAVQGDQSLTLSLENRTPHPVELLVDGGALRLSPVLPTPRLEEVRTPAGVVSVTGRQVPLSRLSRAGVVDLPDRREGVGLIVSALVAQALPDREDLFVPDDVVRDRDGVVVGCRALARLQG